MATVLGVSARGAGMGNPSLRNNGEIEGLSAPPPVGVENAGMTAVLRRREEQDAAFRAADARLPQSVSPRGQARMANGRFGR